ncbi:hypothetical protein EV421DRAFT_298098 [Armillaria borealis]|uniref:Secreted protein n=1 Tax=Armillaria borealis TaxID=47425 RepID=A0AA39JQ11_9AGAR|nr:hypothetical protein EV421DRAFT_298098 [Armillaria borealis]
MFCFFFFLPLSRTMLYIRCPCSDANTLIETIIWQPELSHHKMHDCKANSDNTVVRVIPAFLGPSYLRHFSHDSLASSLTYSEMHPHLVYTLRSMRTQLRPTFCPCLRDKEHFAELSLDRRTLIAHRHRDLFRSEPNVLTNNLFN